MLTDAEFRQVVADHYGFGPGPWTSEQEAIIDRYVKMSDEMTPKLAKLIEDAIWTPVRLGGRDGPIV